MTVLVTDRRDMRRDQYPGIGPEPLRRRVLEFADINIERCAAQMIALERVGKRLLVDDLTPGNVDEHASRLHRCKAILVEETGGLRCPLAADHHEIALRQEPIEISGAAKLAESRWRGPVWVRVWDVHADLDSLGAVIRLWLTRHERWPSPVYLVGESYGGFRAAALASSLPHDVDVTVSGIVLISPALDMSALHPSERDLLAAGFFLPTFAATAAALRLPETGADLAAVERFALSDYLIGLAGLPAQPPAGNPFLDRVAKLTGLSEDIVRRYRGRVPSHVFAREILRAQGEAVSLYDGTIVRPAPADDRGGAGDPLLRPAAADFGAAFNTYVATALGYHTDQPYRVLAGNVAREWNWDGESHEGGTSLPMASLEAALIAHPGTKVLIVNGRYDLVTPYLSSRWLVDQLPVPPATRAQIRLAVYQGGHMMYLRPASREALARDAAQLYPTPGLGAPSQ